jgi:hypothetical protein
MNAIVEKLKVKKILVIVGIGLYSLIYAVITEMFYMNSGKSLRLAVLLGSLSVNFGIVWWAALDCRERGKKLTMDWRIVMVIFGYLALVGYLLRSRGKSNGLIAILWSILIIMICEVLWWIVIKPLLFT